MQGQIFDSVVKPQKMKSRNYNSVVRHTVMHSPGSFAPMTLDTVKRRGTPSRKHFPADGLAFAWGVHSHGWSLVGKLAWASRRAAAAAAGALCREVFRSAAAGFRRPGVAPPNRQHGRVRGVRRGRMGGGVLQTVAWALFVWATETQTCSPFWTWTWPWSLHSAVQTHLEKHKPPW